MDASILFPEVILKPAATSVEAPAKAIENKQLKSFASVVSNNVCDIPLSQLPTPCLKGDRLAISIPEEKYQLGVETCKHHLYGRVVWTKGTTPLTVVNLSKLLELWPKIGNWEITSLGKGIFEFAFSSLEDIQRV